jgi:hypothetical protein
LLLTIASAGATETGRPSLITQHSTKEASSRSTAHWADCSAARIGPFKVKICYGGGKILYRAVSIDGKLYQLYPGLNRLPMRCLHTPVEAVMAQEVENCKGCGQREDLSPVNPGEIV